MAAEPVYSRDGRIRAEIHKSGKLYYINMEQFFDPDPDDPWDSPEGYCHPARALTGTLTDSVETAMREIRADPRFRESEEESQ